MSSEAANHKTSADKPAHFQFTLIDALWHVTIWSILFAYNCSLDLNAVLVARFAVLVIVMEILRAFFPTFRKLAVATAVLHLIIIAQGMIIEAIGQFECAIYLLTSLALLYYDLNPLTWIVLVFALSWSWNRDSRPSVNGEPPPAGGSPSAPVE